MSHKDPKMSTSTSHKACCYYHYKKKHAQFTTRGRGKRRRRRRRRRGMRGTRRGFSGLVAATSMDKPGLRGSQLSLLWKEQVRERPVIPPKTDQRLEWICLLPSGPTQHGRVGGRHLLVSVHVVWKVHELKRGPVGFQSVREPVFPETRWTLCEEFEWKSVCVGG